MSIKHKRFQQNYPAGGIEVQFNLEGEGKNIVVNTIQIHDNFESGLPDSPELEYDYDTQEWKLFTYYKMDNTDGTTVTIREWVNKPFAKEIVEEIVRIKEEEPPM